MMIQCLRQQQRAVCLEKRFLTFELQSDRSEIKIINPQIAAASRPVRSRLQIFNCFLGKCKSSIFAGELKLVS